MAYLWLAGIVAASFYAGAYLLLLWMTLRASPRPVLWQQWAFLATGLAGSFMFILDQMYSRQHHIYSGTGDLHLVSLLLCGGSSIFLWKIAARRRA
jgi:hypothetical protein